MRMVPFVAAIVAAPLLLTACGASDYSPQAGATPETVFADACAACHGDDGSGRFGLLKVKGTGNSEAEIVEKIVSGSTLMPAFPNIGQAEIAALAQYLKE